MAKKVVTISPTEALSTGKDIFLKNWKDVVKLAIVVGVINFIFGIAAGMIAEDGGALSGLVSFAGNLLSAYLGYGFFKAMFMLYDKKPVDIQTLAQPINEAAKYVIGSLLYSLAVMVGFVFLFFPGLYVATKYFFVPSLLADTDMSIGDAFSASSKMTEGKKFDIFLYMVLTTIAVFVGLLALIVGAFVVSWMAMFGMIVMYRGLLAKAKK
jgi:uncharacterized membrane protein